MNAIGYIIRIMAAIIFFLFFLHFTFPSHDSLITGLIVLAFCSIIVLLCIDTIDTILIKISQNICGNGNHSSTRRQVAEVSSVTLMLQRTMLWFNRVLQLMTQVWTLIHHKHRQVTKNVSKNELQVSKIQALTTMVPKVLFINCFVIRDAS